jgi:hypothetical protein
MSLTIAITFGQVVAACGADGDADRAGAPRIEVRAGGTVHVRNAEVGMWAEGEGWRLVEDVRIGAVDGRGPDVFGNVMSLSLAVDDEGRMFVLDGQANEVRVFDASGAHVRTFGRAGSGPGEMRGPTLAGWGPDATLWIADPANARYTVFSRDGAYVASHRRAIGFSMRPWPGTIGADGRIYDIGIGSGEGVEHVIVRVEPMTAAADTFALPSYDGGWFHLLNRAGLPMRSVSIPFAGQLLWRLDPRGYVWSAVTDCYVIAQQNLDGDTLLIVEREQRPIRVSAEERAAALDGLQDFIAAGGRVEPARIPSTKPALHGFTVDDRGYLWVVPQREAGGGRRPYDVFDPSGRYLGEVTGSTGVMVWPAAPVFRDDYVYGFTVDDLQVPYLVRLRIEGRASSPTPARAR